MVNFLKKYWIAILIVVAVIIAAILIIRRYRTSISFDFSLGGNLESILSNITGRFQDANARGIGFYIDVPLTTIIKNNNAASIVLKNIAGTISYNGESIIQTQPNSASLQEVVVEGRSSFPITDNVKFLVNASTIKFITDLIKGEKPAIKYNFSTLLFGKPTTLTNITTITAVTNPTGS